MDSKKDIFATREGKQDFAIALIVIIIFAIFIYQFVFNSSDEEIVPAVVEIESVINEVTPVIETEEELQYSYTSSTTNKATTIQVVDSYESESSTAVVVSDIIESTPITADEDLEPSSSTNETILLYEAQKRVADSIANATKEDEDEQLIDPTNEITTEASAPVEITEVAPAKVATKETLNCVVIVGVFKEAANKAKVISKLNSLGYSHSEGILRENINYVGVPVNCDDAQMREKLLNDLNKAFGIDAWVKRL